jgi:hypothetical protein
MTFGITNLPPKTITLQKDVETAKPAFAPATTQPNGAVDALVADVATAAPAEAAAAQTAWQGTQSAVRGNGLGLGMEISEVGRGGPVDAVAELGPQAKSLQEGISRIAQETLGGNVSVEYHGRDIGWVAKGEGHESMPSMIFKPNFADGGMHGLEVTWNSNSRAAESKPGIDQKKIDNVPLPADLSAQGVAGAIRDGQSAYDLGLARFPDDPNFSVSGGRFNNGTTFEVNHNSLPLGLELFTGNPDPSSGKETEVVLKYNEVFGAPAPLSVPRNVFSGMQRNALADSNHTFKDYMNAATRPEVATQFNGLQQLGKKYPPQEGAPGMEWKLGARPGQPPEFTFDNGWQKVTMGQVTEGPGEGKLAIQYSDPGGNRIGYIDPGVALQVTDVPWGFEMLQEAWAADPKAMPTVAPRDPRQF